MSDQDTGRLDDNDLPLDDEDIKTELHTGGDSAADGVDADGTDADGADADGTDADASDGDATDVVDGDTGDA